MNPTIPDLPTAGTVNDTDQFLVRQPAGGAGTDKKATAAQIRNLNIAGLSALSGTPVETDNFIVARSGTNYRVPFSNLGFKAGTILWFYLDSDAGYAGWDIVGTGDMLLAVKGGATYTTGQSEQGNWQIPDHTLTVDEMPQHRHSINQIQRRRPGSPESGNSFNAITPVGAPGTSTLSGSLSGILNEGGGQAHTHGTSTSYRPRAKVGILMVKN